VRYNKLPFFRYTQFHVSFTLPGARQEIFGHKLLLSERSDRYNLIEFLINITRELSAPEIEWFPFFKDVFCKDANVIIDHGVVSSRYMSLK